MVTTIQITEELQQKLASRKLFDKETYEEVIWDLIEDSQAISEETKAELMQARKEPTHSLASIKKEAGL